MALEIVIPAAGESISSANVAQWHKENGATVKKGDILVTLETDKVSNELEAEGDGVLKIIVTEGEEVEIGTTIGTIDDAGSSSADSAPSEEKTEPVPVSSVQVEEAPAPSGGKAVDILVPAAGESINSASVGQWHKSNGDSVKKGDILVTLETDKVSNDLEAESDGTLEILVEEGEEVGIGSVIGRVSPVAANSSPAPEADKPATKVLKDQPTEDPPKQEQPQNKPAATSSAPTKPNFSAEPAKAEVATPGENDGRTTRKKMSMIRRKIASHLVNAQHTAAILSTFNECDMTAIMKLRKDVQQDFIAKHGVKLGFMSFFVKAAVQALKEVPSINAQIDGQDIVQNHFFDIGVAIGTEKGLIVPVLRDCDKKSFAQIEQDIIDYANKAKDGQIEMSDLQGGVFTISNGGVYGSLLSTPILNPPQSGILGMHTIQQRPMAVNGEVKILPMMYLALSYDHRLVDGKEAVTFLITLKDCIENPARLMLEM